MVAFGRISQGADPAAAIKLSAASREVIFHFTETPGGSGSAGRLLYKLEGHDLHWRDLKPAPGMMVSLQFTDIDRLIVGTETFAFVGQSAGWRPQVEEAEFHFRREHAIIPARASDARWVLSSSGENAGVGVIAIDGARAIVEHRSTGATDYYDWEIRDGKDWDQPLGQPQNWVREGPRAEMAQLRVRQTPSPHPILVIVDDDPNRHGVWSTSRSKLMKVEPGDRLTLEWSQAYSIGSGGPGEARYRNLKPGRYWFRVAAANVVGQLTGREVSVAIDVVPPLLQRPGFWVSFVGLLGVLATVGSRALIRRRMQRRIEEIERLHILERERTRIARDLHDDIGGGLTEIAMQSDWVRRDLAQGITPDTLRRIERVSQSAVELTRSVDEIVWAVNPSHDRLDRFAAYLSQSTEQFLDAANIRVRFDFASDLPPLTLPGPIRHNLYLAIREALNNAFKHSGSDLIRLGLRLEGQELVAVVEDNGSGFPPENTTPDGSQDGLENMRRRMQEMGGGLRLNTQPGQGTRLEFRLPLPLENN